MHIRLIGESPFLEGYPSRFRKGIGTLCPARDVLITLPGIHATQRLALIDELNEVNAKEGQPALTEAEMDEVIFGSVNLYFDEERILIRPDPENLEAAFDADEALQTLTSKTNIKFLQAADTRVLQAIKRRGESWRVTPLPRSPGEIRDMIGKSRAPIHGEPIYYHNRLTGSRYLTCAAFQRLAELPLPRLAAHLQEIKKFAVKQNRLGHQEIIFFQARAFGGQQFESYNFAVLPDAELRGVFQDLARRFADDVAPEFQRDDLEDPNWRQAMFCALVGEQDKSVSEEILLGLSSEYFLQLQWLPGCRIGNGEIFPDSVFDECREFPEREELASLCDPKVRSFIFNAVREYGELDYINVAHIPSALSRGNQTNERRGVYLAEIKPPGQENPVVRIIRMQKHDVVGHLDDGMDLGSALFKATNYSDYILDRRLACRQLGMNLLPRIQMGRLREIYHGPNAAYRGQLVWSIYYERDYCPGLASDKTPLVRLRNPEYALRLARLLGKAAAPNLIMGRQDQFKRVLFDDGDEIVREEGGMPVEIVIGDATGSFADPSTPLEESAEDYARPILNRWAYLEQPTRFCTAYLEAFVAEFSRIKGEYLRKRRAFDVLFHHWGSNSENDMADRWVRVLARLERTEPEAVADRILNTVQTKRKPAA